MKKLVIAAASLALAGCAGMSPDPQAPKVKITALGSHAGEFCPLDRALVFEDPDGTRILYDPGRTVRGPNDERLGRIDAVLLSHVHGDHLGDLIQPSANAGACPKRVARPFGVEIAATFYCALPVAPRRSSPNELRTAAGAFAAKSPAHVTMRVHPAHALNVR